MTDLRIRTEDMPDDLSRPEIRWDEETFTGVAYVPPLWLLNIEARMMDQRTASAAIFEFLDRVFPGREGERLRKVIEDPARLVRIRKVSELCMGLIGWYARRPIGQPSGSEPGGLHIETSPAEGSSSPDSNPTG